MEPYPRTWVDVDLRALRENISAVRTRLGDGVKVALVVKADAYGHGLVPVGRFASRNGADVMAVATVQEGIALRDAGVDVPIMVMSPTLPVEAEQAVFYDLDVFVESAESATGFSEAAKPMKREARLHLKVDTGLHRFGCSWKCAVDLARTIRKLPAIRLVGVAQHFADSSRDPEYTRLQLARWESVLKGFSEAGIDFEFVQAANSAAAVRFPESRGNLVRLGIVAYGIDPYNLLEGEARQVLSWTSRLTALRTVSQGEPVGYGGTFITPRRTIIGTVGVGYGDGYPRALSNRGIVGVKGQRAPVVGLVCMDQLLVDLTEVEGAGVGDLVELIGPTVTVETLAPLADTNVHEIVTRVMSRVPRRYRQP